MVLVPFGPLRWYRLVRYDGTDCSATVVPIRPLRWYRLTDTINFPVVPLLHRFLSMHGVCRRMAADSELIRYKYVGSQLQGNYLTFTYDDWGDDQEYQQYVEDRKAWRFGHIN